MAAAGAVRAGLEELGVRKGDPVAVMMSNRREFVEAWFGLAYAGAIEVPVNPKERGERLVHVLNHSQARLAVVSAGCLEELERQRDRLTSLARVVVIDGPVESGFESLDFAEVRSALMDYVEKYRAKHAIDTIAYRFGDVAASWLNTALIAIAGGWALIGAAVPLAAVWLGLAAVLGAGFRRRVTKEEP